jgi:hypothetical protein
MRVWNEIGIRKNVNEINIKNINSLKPSGNNVRHCIL